MKIGEKKVGQICDAVTGVHPSTVEAVFMAASTDAQLVFVQGEGHQTLHGKSVYPDYLVVQISDAQVAMALAQQLMSACSTAINKGGVLAHPVSLQFAGQAIISE